MSTLFKRVFRNYCFCYKSLSNLTKNHFNIKVNYRHFGNGPQNKKIYKSNLRLAFLAAATGVGAGTAYSLLPSQEQPVILNPVLDDNLKMLDEFPNVKISRRVIFPNDSSELEISLFQYPTCPFCCKVRAFLDYCGISYDVVEVNPVLRQQLKWTDYKKVPILLVKVGGKYLQLNDSTMIISALTSYLVNKQQGLLEVAKAYPAISFVDDDRKEKKEILNRYFLMYHDSVPQGKTKEMIVEERKWRQWADDRLVHVLSPNVYRTLEESLESFGWFAEVGDWVNNFSRFESHLIVYVGAFAMWLIGKRLKKRHQLKEDVRTSLYDETKVWLREVRKAGSTFHGGDTPDLADLAVYGVLSSIEGCSAFKDLLANTNIRKWYYAVKEKVEDHTGALQLVHYG